MLDPGKGVGGYEAATAATLSFLLHRFDLRAMFDIGASRGFFALLAASTQGREVTAHAFEMSPPQYAGAVSDYAKRPELAGRLHAHLAGMSDRHEGERDIWFSRTRMFEREPDPSEYREAWWRRLKFYLRGISNRDRLQKAVITLTSIDHMAGQCPPDILKIDVDGHEALVLKGGESTFRASRPFILLELHSDELLGRFGKTRREVIAPLFAMGYRAAFIRDHNRVCTGVFKIEADSPQFDRQATEMFLFY
jgi:FkbM family methyltransferase